MSVGAGVGISSGSVTDELWRPELECGERAPLASRGLLRYVADLNPPGLLHMEVVRSPVARGRILRVSGGITSRELRAYISPPNSRVRQPVLAEDYVSYYGQPLAVVYGGDPYEARDLADSVEVELEPEDPVVTMDQALSSPPIHPGMEDNVASRFEAGGPVERGEVVVEDVLEMERVVPNPMEPRGVLAWYAGGVLNVWASTQSAYSWRSGISVALGIPEDSVRVHEVPTGGAFGVKSAVYPEYVAAAYISMRTGRPVSWIESREEHLAAARPGRGARARMRIHASRSGAVTGLEAELVVDVGAYADLLSMRSPQWIATQITGPYAIGSARATGLAVHTNKAPLGPYRGAGRPEAAFFIERMMDALADELGIDPVELRLMNLPRERFTSPLGLTVDPSREFFEEGLRRMGLRDPAARGRNAGISFAILIPAVHGGEGARISTGGGEARVWLGGSDQGQRHLEMARSVLREVLGIPGDRVRLMCGDTVELPDGIGTWGSRSAIAAGNALWRAAQMIREAAARDGRRTPEEILDGSYDVELMEDMDLDPSMISFLLTEAEAELVGGVEPRVRRVAAYYDVGTALSEDSIRGQITGGLAQATSEVLFEALMYDDRGIPLAETMSSVGVPHSVDLPDFEVHVASSGRSTAPHGAKGVGEAGTVGGPPAISRAIELALGRRVRSLPVFGRLL
ncbi:MAG: xanthine dehydrogenase family protein molybdopterin-binding subunit [Conexivisphaera sp.]